VIALFAKACETCVACNPSSKIPRSGPHGSAERRRAVKKMLATKLKFSRETIRLIGDLGSVYGGAPAISDGFGCLPTDSCPTVIRGCVTSNGNCMSTDGKCQSQG
jgi:hypothetical protein